MPSVPKMNEDEFIRELRSKLPRNSEWVDIGVGDDASVLTPPQDEKLLVSTDAFVEGVHFDRQWTRPRLWGKKALFAAASDIAAMGGALRAALLSVSFGENETQTSLWQSVEGFLEGCEELGVDWIGGDLSRALETSFHVTVIGASVGGRVLTRSGARAGDAIYVSGSPGLSAAGLCFLEEGARLDAGELSVPESLNFLGDELVRSAIRAHVEPVPQLELGRFLCTRGLATSCMDLSDGISRDLPRLCSMSDTGARVNVNRIPINEKLRAAFDTRAVQWALEGGEDYELLFTGDAESLAAAQSSWTKNTWTRIGEIVPQSEGIRARGKGLSLRELQPSGWDHFDRMEED